MARRRRKKRASSKSTADPAKTPSPKRAERREGSSKDRALIIANEVSRLQTAGQFLTRRGVETVVVGTLPEAIKLVTSARPKYVFLSFNLKAANIVKTEKLLSKTFNVKCCVFPETNDSRTMAVLSRSPFKYSMMGNVSGPSLHMQIKKIERQDEMEEKRKKQMLERARERMNDSASDTEAVTVEKNKFASEVRGGEWAPLGKDKNGKDKWLLEADDLHAGQYTYTGNAPPEKREDGAWEIPEDGEIEFYPMPEEDSPSNRNQYSNQDNEEPDILSEFADQFSVDEEDMLDYGKESKQFNLSDDEVKPSEGVHFQEKVAPKQKKKLYMPFTENGYHEKDYDGPTSAEFNEETIEGLLAEDPDESQTSNTENDFTDSEIETGPQTASVTKSEEGSNANSFSEIIDEKPETSAISETEVGPQENSYTESEVGPEANMFSEIEETPKLESKKRKEKKEEFVPDSDQNLCREDVASGSNMAVAEEKFKDTAEATFDALLDVLDTEDEVENFVEDPKKMRIFSLVTQAFQGLVVMSVAGDKDLGQEINLKIKEKLAYYLKLKKIEFDNLDSFHLEAEEIEFKSWSQNLAKYTIQTQHKKDEILCSFIEIKEVVGAIQESPDPKMAAVELKNISSDIPLTFDAHLYFPVNAKYIHYVGKGGVITEAQKTKLVSSNFKQIHIKKAESGLYLRYCIINYILNAVNSNANLFKNAV